MNSFVLTAITLCLAAQCALAHYQSHNNGYLPQQRKTAPTPQTYGQQGYQTSQYANQANEYETSNNHYEQPSAYRAPSSAAVSSYDERTPAASYSKPAAPAYARQQNAYAAPQTYAAPQAYAKAAPKYEEPSYPPMPFAWGYDINDGYGGAQYHKENGDEYGKRTGSYGYTDAYGVYRQVDYVADEHGFRATVKTNEPGTANESPADVEMHAYEPPSNYYAGQSNKAAYSAPASYSAPAAPASYSALRAASYQPSGYGAQASRPAYKGAYGHAQRAYEPAQQYSSSQLVPVYQKAKVVQAPAKHY